MKTILIVDDDPDNVQMLVDVLMREQYATLTAANGVECLKIAQEESPDLILLDVHMPVMDGYETIRHLRQMKKHKFTPMVFVTGYATTPKAIDSGYALGSTEYWTKPISSEELIVRVRAVLRIADAEKQLRQVQQSFYSMIVHDLRNPIGAILGMSDFLLEDRGSIGSDQAEMLVEINTASMQLLRIVRDLLELSQFESGEYQLQRKRIPLKQIVDVSLAKVNAMRHQKHITLDVDIEPTIAPSVDGEYFREVFDNLFDNALRYTPANGMIRVRARLRPAQVAAGTESIVIEVVDTGCGIPEAEIATLFDKSRITNAAFRKANTRTGLGLAVCREIIEAHDGTITVTSTMGEGTMFTLTLPN
jgi:two-component system sensor histidine kinase/response regulator